MISRQGRDQGAGWVGRRTGNDLGRGGEQRLHEEVDEADLALGLQRGVRVFDDRHGQVQARLEERLLRPFLEQDRRPVLRDIVRASLRGAGGEVKASVERTSKGREEGAPAGRRTGLLMSEHLMSAWQIMMRSSHTSASSAEHRSSAILSPSSPSLTIQPKCIAMSVAMMDEKRILRNPVQSSAGPSSVGGLAVELAAVPKMKLKPCLRSSVVMSRQCMFSRTDESL